MKRLLKLLASAALGGTDALRHAARRATGRPVPGRCTVLYYHAIPATHRTHFARQLDTLLAFARPVPATFDGPVPDNLRYVVVTFDDAFASVIDNAMPELSQRNIPWTVFVPSGRLGQPPTWLRNAAPEVRHERVMTADELRDLARDPLVTVASHTLTHADLPRLSPADASRELSESRAVLESVLQQPVDLLSYPYGAHTPALHEQARQLGYRRVFTSDPVPAFLRPGEFVTGRVSVEPHDGLLDFRLKMTGAYRWSGRRRTLHSASSCPR